MSDCGRLAGKIKMLSDVVQKSLYNSLRAFKALVLSLAETSKKISSEKKPKGDGSFDHCEPLAKSPQYTVVQLLLQNFKTDYKIYILSHLNLIEESPENTEKNIESAKFCLLFKNLVDPVLYQEEVKRKRGETEGESEGNMQNILGDLKKENDVQEEESAILKENEKNTSPIEKPREKHANIPEDLIDKLAVFAGESSDRPGNNIVIGKSQDHIIDATVSKIQNMNSDRELEEGKRRESCLSSLFSPEEKLMLEDIKENTKELNTNLKAITPSGAPRNESQLNNQSTIHNAKSQAYDPCFPSLAEVLSGGRETPKLKSAPKNSMEEDSKKISKTNIINVEPKDYSSPEKNTAQVNIA